MRILFLHEVNYETKPIFEMHEFPEHLSARGHEVGFVQFPEGSDKSQLKKLPFLKTVEGRVVQGSKINLYTPKVSSGLLGRLAFAFRAGSFMKSVLQDFKPDVVVSFAVPTSGWQSLRACQKLNVPYLFRALDVSHKIRKSIFSSLIRLAEKYIYRNADWVSCNNVAMESYCHSLGATDSRTSVENPPLDITRFASQEKIKTERLRDALGLPVAANVALYMGSFFYFSGLPELITSFASSRKSGDYLVLVGGGEQDAELRKLAAALQVEEFVKFTGFVGFDDLSSYLGLATVAVNPMHPSSVSNTAFPNKVIQYMAKGLPVVSTRLDGLTMTFGEKKGLAFVSQPEEVFDKAQQLFANTNLAELGKGNQKAVSSKFSIPTTVVAMEKRLLQLIEASK